MSDDKYDRRAFVAGLIASAVAAGVPLPIRKEPKPLDQKVILKRMKVTFDYASGPGTTAVVIWEDV